MRAHAKSLTRSSIVSLTAAAGEFAALPLLLSVLAPWAAFAAVQVVGTTVSFLLNRQWSFDRARHGRMDVQAAKSIVVFGGSAVLNTVLPSVGSYVFHMPPMIAFAVSNLVTFLCWNYTLNRVWVFPGR